MYPRYARSLLALITAIGISACGGEDRDAENGEGSSGTSSEGSTGAGTGEETFGDLNPNFTASVGEDGRVTYFCTDSDGDGEEDIPCECSDGADNDGANGADHLDYTCVSGWDDDEGSFGTGMPGDNSDLKKQDCFFDGNSGNDEGCAYDTVCMCADTDDDGKPGPCTIAGTELKKSNPKCDISDDCVKNCQPKVPNGCDCFGCCTYHRRDKSVVTLFMVDGCNPETGEGCSECIQAEACLDPCEECELCLGKNEVPASCGGGTGQAECTNKQACTQPSDCPDLHSCILGCCVADTTFEVQ